MVSDRMLFRGKPLEEMSKDELFEAIQDCDDMLHALKSPNRAREFTMVARELKLREVAASQ
jgi:hypothetical protein